MRPTAAPQAVADRARRRPVGPTPGLGTTAGAVREAAARGVRALAAVAVGLAAIAPPAVAQPFPMPVSPAFGQAAPAGAFGVPPDEVLEARGAVVGEIFVLIEDVFDSALPEENRALYRLANRLHVNTHHEVIRRQLLIASGQPYSARLLRESERLLRGRDYLYDCAIRPIAYRGNRVDLEVWVKDVWTIKPGLSFGRGGGANDWRVELEDRNLLGTGKRVALDWEETVDRTSVTAQYVDSSLAGSRAELETLYADNSDGEEIKLAVARPFFAFDTRWAVGGTFLGNVRTDTLYALGRPLERIDHRQRELELFAGRSRGLASGAEGGAEGGRVRRWLAGVTYRRDRYRLAPAAVGIGPAAGELETAAAGLPAGRVPEDRELVYPWIGYESVGDAYTTTRNQDQLGRTEDLLLGTRHRVRLGFASESLGSLRDQLVFRLSSERGWSPSPKTVVLGTAAALGRWSGDGFQNLVALAEGRFYRRVFGRHLLFVDLQLAAARDLDGWKLPKVHRVGGDRRPTLQLLLGGETGLRGYPLRYQDGDGRALVTVEQRFFTGFYPLRLAFVGAAVFFDLGRTWPGEESGPNLGWLADAGFGLRLSSSRSGFGTVVHLDVAFPLDRDPSIDSVQFLVTSKQSL